MILGVCLCVCVHAHGFLYIICACMQKPENTLRYHFSGAIHNGLIVSSGTESPYWPDASGLDWLSSKPQEPACLCLTSTTVPSVCHYAQLCLDMGCADQTQLLTAAGQALPSGAVSPASCLRVLKKSSKWDSVCLFGAIRRYFKGKFLEWHSKNTTQNSALLFLKS